MNIQSVKLELMKQLLDTQDANILKHIQQVFEGAKIDGFELSDEQKTELDIRTQLRHDGKLKASSWNEAKARILTGSANIS